MLDKTKATMPGRQCSTENREQNQHTRPAAGGQSLSAPEITGTAPLARFTPVLAFTPWRGTALQHTQSPEFSVATISQIVGCILNTRQYFPQWGECEPVAGTLILRPSLGGVQILPLCSSVLGRSNTWYWAYTKNVGQAPDLAFAQAFGSIPSFFNFSRQASFTHELNWPEPAASLICSSSSSSKRMFLAVLLERSKSRLGFFSCIGIYHSCRVNIDGIYHLLLKQVLKTAKPGSALTLAGPLTKPLIGVTVMADKQHTQTHPKFTWLFLGIPKGQTCTPVVIRIAADTEKEAREWYSRWDLTFAAKIRSECPLYQHINGAYELTIAGLEVRHD